MRWSLLVCVALAAGCGKGSGSGSGGERPADPKQDPRPARYEVPADAKPVEEIAAGALWLTYGQNAALAEGRYAGKVVHVYGQLQSVAKEGDDYLLGFSVYLDEDPAKGPGTVCRFSADWRDDLGMLKVSREVRVVGRVAGRDRARSPDRAYSVVLEGCRIAK